MRATQRNVITTTLREILIFLDAELQGERVVVGGYSMNFFFFCFPRTTRRISVARYIKISDSEFRLALVRFSAFPIRRVFHTRE